MSNKISVSEEQYQLDHKYRPTSIDEIILPEDFKKAFKGYIKKGSLPHLLLHSSEPGTGKTTTARALVNDLGLDPRSDYLFLHGDDVNLSFIHNELSNFCINASPTGKRRVVIIDEYDRPTLGEAQKAMRGVIDEFSNTVSFVITANNPQNIHSALRDRLHMFNFGITTDDDKERMQIAFRDRMMQICELEGIEVTDKRILSYIVQNHFPYFRKCLTQLSMYAFSNNNVLDEGFLKKVIKRERSTKDVVSILSSERIDRDVLMSIAKSNSANSSLFLNNLYTDVSKMIDDASHDKLIKILGEMNKTWNMATNKDLHLFYLLYQIAIGVKWKRD